MSARALRGTVPTLELPRALEGSLRRGHPWVYRNHVPSSFHAEPGWVRVKAGQFVGYGIWDRTSPIAVRLFSTRGVPDASWLGEAVRRAWDLRAGVRAQSTSAFRWLFGEGDGLPGVTVDVYGSFAVVITYADALDALLPELARALASVTELAGVVHRDRETGQLVCLHGRLPPREVIVEEHGVRLYADLHESQKTGLFLDHRDNREFVRAQSSGKTVLNLFAYTGAFSLYAALGGATRVTSVDSAAPGIARARDNFALNGLDAAAHEFVAGDVFEFLERAHAERRHYDLVICDPPSFAKNKEQVAGARKAYTRLNARGFAVTARGGLYAAASCTSLIPPEEFRELLAQSAESAKRRFQIIHEAGHAVDHPVMAHHPEGRYLKFVVGRILDVA